MIQVGAIYKHTKSRTNYLVLSLATHSETLEPMVVYIALYDSNKSQVWVRPASMWNEVVNSAGVKVPRFELVSQSVIKD